MLREILTYFLMLLIFAVQLNAGGRSGDDIPFRPDRSSIDFATRKLKKMSLNEKLGQLVHIGINAKYMNRDEPEYRFLMEQITELKIGGIVVFAGGIYETVHLVNRAQNEADIPLLISADFETGIGMRFSSAENFPWNMAVAATGNSLFAERLGYLTSIESKALGVSQVFAPVVDVNNNALNPVINVRSFGEDPQTVSEFGSAFASGLQKGNVLATAKHFPGHGDTDVDSHRGLPVIAHDRKRLESIEFFPFRELIKSGVGSVMVSHISLPSLDGEIIKPLPAVKNSYGSDPAVITEGTTMPATLSKPIISGILRNEMGFDGLVVTDAMDMNGLTIYFDPKEAAVRAVEAGNDVLLKPVSARETIEGLREAVESGRLNVRSIDAAVSRQLAWKHKLGLFKNRTADLDAIDTIVSGADSRRFANDVANNAITLVKSERGILPLAKDKKILILAITNGRDFDFVGRAFRNGLSEAGIQTRIISIDERSGKDEVLRAEAAAAESDIVIAGLFGRVRSGAKNSVELPSAGNSLLKSVLAGNKPVVTIAFGNPYFLNAFPECKTYIVSYGDMESLQTATAKALAGRIEFKGKLPITIGPYKTGTGITGTEA